MRQKDRIQDKDFRLAQSNPFMVRLGSPRTDLLLRCATKL
jgi:hypothetical protein